MNDVSSPRDTGTLGPRDVHDQVRGSRDGDRTSARRGPVEQVPGMSPGASTRYASLEVTPCQPPLPRQMGGSH